jgi:hypothetical protein
MRVVRSAEKLFVVRANTHSDGDAGGVAYTLQHALRRFELRITQTQRHEVGDYALPIGDCEPFSDLLADLRRIEAHPDLADSLLRRPQREELLEIPGRLIC